MKLAYRATILVALLLLAACGGGGSSSSAGSGGSGTGGSGSGGSGGSGGTGGSPTNVAAVTVDAGPTGVTNPTFNIPSVTVTVCNSTGTCATIDHVLVDTGSSGLRLMASVLASKGVTLAPEMDASGNAIHECYPFADGYSWGTVATATVEVAGESTGESVPGGIPVQVIDDSATPSPGAPTACTGSGATSLNSVSLLNANGMLGVGVFVQDCGSACVSNAGNNVYFSCASSPCASEAAALTVQVSNPVASFQTDNNGSIVEMPSVPAAGAATASGSLIFGIGTASNNAFSATTILEVSSAGAVNMGDFTTTYNGQTLANSFIDSGSNALFFPNSTTPAIALCGSSGGPAQFYCPTTSPLSLTATNQSANGTGTATTVNFQIVNVNPPFNNSNFAISEVGGPATSVNLTNYFDWGLPFFYGRNVYTVISGKSAGGSTGPFFAY